MEDEIIKSGAIAILFYFAIKEFFSFLKARKDSPAKEGSNLLILEELKLMNGNHLTTLQHSFDKMVDAEESGHRHIADVLHADNMQVVQLLGEIKGRQK